MEFVKTSIPDVILMMPNVFEDARGFFMETFRQSDFEHYCGDYRFVQENHSRSAQGILRGLHYQLTQPQGKLVRVTVGEVYDVAVDLRQSSQTFGHYVGLVLSAENKHQLWVPPGFAHGFYVMSDEAELQYKCTDYYDPSDEYSLRWNDSVLNIDWPLLEGSSLRLSEKDHHDVARSWDNAPKFS